MSWLFWVLFATLLIFGIHGYRKGLLKTVLSMGSTILVIVITSWLTPQIGGYIEEHTKLQDTLQQKMEKSLFEELDEAVDLPIDRQIQFIEKLPLPQIMKDTLVENNTAETYEQLAVSKFSEYLSAYVASGLIHGIIFLLAFIITMILMRVILYAVNLITDLPLIGMMDRAGGFAVGILHGIFWIAIFFLVLVLISDTTVGSMLMETIQSDAMLSWIYDKNTLVQILTKAVA